MNCNEFVKSVADPFFCKRCGKREEDHNLPSTAICTIPSKQEIVVISVVLDRSGSMATMRDATIEGFNEFISGQKALGQALFTLVQFDHEYEIVYDAVPITDVVPRDHHNYLPRGNTALLDAISKALAVTYESIQKLSSKPDKVIFVVITDGQENASSECKSKPALVKTVEDRTKDGWQFLFLGCTLEGIKDAVDVGLQAHSAMYTATAAGMLSNIKSLDASVAAVRRYSGTLNSASLNQAYQSHSSTGTASIAPDNSSSISMAQNPSIAPDNFPMAQNPEPPKK
jgi:hypothetical protein